MGGQNKERKSRGGHGLFDWDKIRDDRWKGVYLGSSVHGISSRYTKVKDLEWYKKVDGKEMVVDSKNELDEIKRKEEEAFAQALGYAAPTVKKSVPKVSTEELKQVITATNSNYNNEQGGIGYSNDALKDFKDSIKDHLQVPKENDKKVVYKSSQSMLESRRYLSRDGEGSNSIRDNRRRSRSPHSRRRDHRQRSPSPIESEPRRRDDRRRSRSPSVSHSRRDNRRRRSRSPMEPRRGHRQRSPSPSESHSRKRDERKLSQSPKSDRSYSRDRRSHDSRRVYD